MRLMFVHGIAQGGKDPGVLTSEWLGALKEGLTRAGMDLPPNVEVDFPFYADRLDQFVEEFGLPSDASVLPKGSPVDKEYEQFRIRVAEEIRVRRGISDQQIRQEIPNTTLEKGVQNWAWVQAILRLVDKQVPDLTQTTLEVFLRDVFLYTQREVVQKAIDKIVAEKLTQDTLVVVGHSLGSVVAYNVLKTAGYKVPLFVTVGSPLGISTINKTVRPLCNPAGSGGWYNAYDKHDVVALYPLDSDHFGVSPAITNNGSVENWTSNKHGIIGYLDDANVAAAICSGLAS
ncbi:MAG TPA: hypothetical protein VF573_17320 [Paraburkholderia sp.]|uniref:hypothetical protein n=1 Tax=Paraburkholderia sp. TaxID=1926495 RepID=UPI002ED4B2C3